ncbi:MAG: hypothetical protein RIR70_1228 [Pseudomonadota bacterium]|jgi:hypothetical protein
MQETLIAAIALLAANAPFVSQRAFLFFPLPQKRQPKSLGVALLELALLYLATGTFATLLEIRAHGSRYPQNWEFFVVTLCLFVVAAFPGFVWRYLWRPVK